MFRSCPGYDLNPCANKRWTNNKRCPLCEKERKWARFKQQVTPNREMQVERNIRTALIEHSRRILQGDV